MVSGDPFWWLSPAGGEAAVIEAAVTWVERIPDDSWPGAWASDEDIKLIIAVQDLVGDRRWPALREIE